MKKITQYKELQSKMIQTNLNNIKLLTLQKTKKNIHLTKKLFNEGYYNFYKINNSNMVINKKTYQNKSLLNHITHIRQLKLSQLKNKQDIKSVYVLTYNNSPTLCVKNKLNYKLSGIPLIKLN